MQCVLTPAEKFMPMTNEDIAAQVDAEVRRSQQASVLWNYTVVLSDKFAAGQYFSI